MAIIERWRLDYNHVRPHSAHDGLSPEAAHQAYAAGQLRDSIGSAGRPLPTAPEIDYRTRGLSQ